MEHKYWSSILESPLLEYAYRAVVEIYRKYGPNCCELPRVFGSEQVLAAYIDGECVGILMFARSDRSTCWVYLMYVSEQHRRSGVMTFLWNALQEKLKGDEYHRIEGGVYLTNEPSLRFWQKMGALQTSVTLTIPRNQDGTHS